MLWGVNYARNYAGIIFAPLVGKRGGRGGGGTGEGESRKRGKGRQEGVRRGKVEGSTNHSIYPLLPNIQTAQLPLKISSSFPLLSSSLPPSFLIYHFRQTKFERYYIMYWVSDKTLQQLQLQTRVGEGEGQIPYMGDCYTLSQQHTPNFLPMQGNSVVLVNYNFN